MPDRDLFFISSSVNNFFIVRSDFLYLVASRTCNLVLHAIIPIISVYTVSPFAPVSIEIRVEQTSGALASF